MHCRKNLGRVVGRAGGGASGTILGTNRIPQRCFLDEGGGLFRKGEIGGGVYYSVEVGVTSPDPAETCRLQYAVWPAQ